jgi:hypothetical protein
MKSIRGDITKVMIAVVSVYDDYRLNDNGFRGTAASKYRKYISKFSTRHQIESIYHDFVPIKRSVTNTLRG